MRALGRTTFDVIHIVTKSGSFEEEALPPNNNRHGYGHAHVPVAAPTTGWKSPVPYLFGGLAAMLGLIGFALLILACSYWKLSGNFDSVENSDDDAGEGDEKVKEADKKAAVFGNSIFVIMAGEDTPTFLATPATSRTTSFGDDAEGKPTMSCYSCSCSSSTSGRNGDNEGGGDEEKMNSLTESENNSSGLS